MGTQSLSTMEFSANIEDLNRDQLANNLIYENNFIVIENEDLSCKSDVDISFPSSSTPYDFDFSYENIDDMLTSSKTSDIKIISSCIDHNYLELDNLSNPKQSCPMIKSNSTLLQTSLSSQLVSIPQNNETSFGWTVVIDNENDIVDASLPPINENNQTKGNSLHEEGEINNFTKPIAEMEQFVFTEMLKDMKDIEDYISAYISSFCILEEEFDNYAAVKSSSEVVSNFLNEMQCSGKDLTEEILEDSKSESKMGEDIICTETKHKNSNFVLKEQSQENCLKKISNQNVSSYCYWEDEAALTSFEMETTTSTNHLDKVIIQENSYRNTALVPLRFFDDIWRNSLKSLDNDDFLQYTCSNDAPFPLYCPSTSMYDPTVLEEAETIVHAVDSFLNGCFYTEQSYRGQNIPCTITELDDDEPFNTGTESSCAIVNHEAKLNHDISNTQAEWNESQILIQSNEESCSATNKNNKKDSKSNEDIENFVKTSNNNIDSNHTRTASAPESNIESTPLTDDKSRDITSVCERFCEPANNINNMVEVTNQIENKILTSYDVTNKNSKNENPSMKGPHNYKQKNKQCSEVSSPLNLHKTRLCSSEYRGNPNDMLVNPLEENQNIKPELTEKNSNRGRSRFVHVQEDNNGNSTKTNYLFSSPNVQLNLTNPLSKERK